ncbi:hypothetical protein PFDG_04282 [Plasmodium falciparum Dd2]|uniref:Plasmodium falciparum erythrocyte membrane protein 1 acidic terminal segment domain-containing protein n=1 Tax=Plasmodium falciparum (isolate Dd2) TaxID=57267 RepID=A0A0L7M4T9_PLAF4|nr:hypothetical protein PFDG_04282 [Plasmodium falciparum Dd2]
MKDIRLVRQVLTHNIHLCIKRMKIINLQLMNGRFLHNDEELIYNINFDEHKNMNFSSKKKDMLIITQNDLYACINLINDSLNYDEHININDQVLKRY